MQLAPEDSKSPIAYEAKQLHEILGMPQFSARQLILDGTIRSFLIGRKRYVRRAECERFMRDAEKRGFVPIGTPDIPLMVREGGSVHAKLGQAALARKKANART